MTLLQGLAVVYTNTNTYTEIFRRQNCISIDIRNIFC